MPLQSRRTPVAPPIEKLNEDSTEHRSSGEHHLGYCFVTLAHPTHAKIAMVLAQSNFDLFHPSSTKPKVDLLGDKSHIDYDEEYKKINLRKIYAKQTRIQEETEKLRNAITKEKHFIDNRDEYLRKVASVGDKDKVAMASYGDHTAREVKVAKSRLNLRNKINELMTLEAEHKYISTSNKLETILPAGIDYDDNIRGRQGGKYPDKNFQKQILLKLLNRVSDDISPGSVRENPRVSEIIGVIIRLT